MSYNMVNHFKPTGDQPQAIKEITENFTKSINRQVLLGVTGSGKTFTMANIIANLNVPTLIITHNKTLAAQLYGEFKKFFPENAVEYFVSYYDYYQPEAYVPSSDVYIEKDSAINDHIDKMRHSATRSLLERRDVIIIASVSCIYGLGSPEAYSGKLISVETGDNIKIDDVLTKLVDIQYERNNYDFHRGIVRVKGDTLEVFPSHEDSVAYRFEFYGDEIERLSEFNPITGKTVKNRDKLAVYPNSHYVIGDISIETIAYNINKDLELRVKELKDANKLVEAQRIYQRTRFDIEMLIETGYCNGIENYSIYFNGRKPGTAPPTLFSYLPKDSLVIIDESHMMIPQLNGMYKGDKSRKSTLVEFGFRLPSALDNRPLKFDEYYKRVNKVLYVSATPAAFELEDSKGLFVEQIIRPTGLIDPKIKIKPAKNQVEDLFSEIRKTVMQNERVLVTTLTKRMAEELTGYYKELGVRVKYLHSDIDTLERIKIIRDLRLGRFDVLVGINLLREGLDIPEVSLVAILDADKEGFLRSQRSLIQTVGRAARNVNSKAIFYADKTTSSMEKAIIETNRRRKKQKHYNKENGIIPETIKNEIYNVLDSIYEKDYVTVDIEDNLGVELTKDREKNIELLEKEMYNASKKLDYERAAKLRDFLFEYKK